MKTLFDTSLIVAGVVESHPMHARCLIWLQRAKAGDFDSFVASHSLAETFAVLTTLPVKPRISPLLAQTIIDNNLRTIAKIVPLTVADYFRTIQTMTELGLSGGTVYDALITTVAQRLAVDKLLTLNTDDFHRVWPEGDQVITTP